MAGPIQRAPAGEIAAAEQPSCFGGVVARRPPPEPLDRRRGVRASGHADAVGVGARSSSRRHQARRRRGRSRATCRPRRRGTGYPSGWDEPPPRHRPACASPGFGSAGCELGISRSDAARPQPRGPRQTSLAAVATGGEGELLGGPSAARRRWASVTAPSSWLTPPGVQSLTKRGYRKGVTVLETYWRRTQGRRHLMSVFPSLVWTSTESGLRGMSWQTRRTYDDQSTAIPSAQSTLANSRHAERTALRIASSSHPTRTNHAGAFSQESPSAHQGRMPLTRTLDGCQLG